MAGLKKVKEDDSCELPIAPMIDCVFLLLIYFMLTSQMKRPETAIIMQNPKKEKEITLQRHKIDIEPLTLTLHASEVRINQKAYSLKKPTLIKKVLKAYSQNCKYANIPSCARISPKPEVETQTIIELLDWIKMAEIQSVSLE